MLRVEGRIVNHDRAFYGEVSIDLSSGLIERVGEPSGRAEIQIDPRCLVFPGFGDVHVHAREDAGGSQAYKEDFRTMSQAAVRGGVVHIAEMPNNPVPPVDDAGYRKKAGLALKSEVHVTLYGGIGPKTNPISFPVPYKVFMGPSVGDLFFTSKTELEKAISRYRGADVSFHCEDPEVLEAHKNEPTHEARRPLEAELSAIDFAVGLVERYGLRGKICHISSYGGVERAIAAKRRGVSLAIEVTPHHLYFDASMLTSENRPWLQMNPPLRTSPEDRLRLLRFLREGDIDYLATDHAPHTIEEKQKGISGVPHLDTYGPFVTWLMKGHRFKPEDVARVSSWNPGRFVEPYLPGSFGKGFGKVEEGYAGSLTIIDPESPITIRREMLKTKCEWSPFEGVTFPGRVLYTILRGKVHTNE
ncbi:amidohydrolase [Candidatus Parcubacteria bacterium]|nr:MAG: amidohydrolase [Candidatus Parcubacteria bacterium]